MPPPLALVGQKGEEWMQGKALMAMVWGVCGFYDVESAIVLDFEAIFGYDVTR